MAHVDIQKYTAHPDGYTEYFIIVSYLGKQWSIKRRFSDFVSLDEACHRLKFEVDATLPARNWWQRFDPFVLQQRQKDLQTYLEAVLQVCTPNDNEELQKFLDVDRHMERSESADNTSEIKVGVLDYQDRLRIIVKDFRSTILMMPGSSGGRTDGRSNPRKIPAKPKTQRDEGLGIASSSGSGGNSGGNSYSDSLSRSFSNSVFSRTRSSTNADSKGALSRNNSGHGAGTTPTGPSSMESGLYTASRNNGKIRRMNTTDTVEDAVASIVGGAAPGGSGSAAAGKERKESMSMFSREGTPGLSQSNAVDHAAIAADVIRRQKFATYMGNTYREYEHHCNLHINNFDRPDPDPEQSKHRSLSKAIASPLTAKQPVVTSTLGFLVPGSNSKSSSGSAAAVKAILSADLDLDDIEYTLDECADHILEATMSHYNLTMSYSSSTSVSTARGTESSHIVVNEFRNPFLTKHDGDHKAYSRSGSGSKYSYFNKEFKRLSTSDKFPSSGHEARNGNGSFKPPSRTVTPGSSVQAEAVFFGGTGAHSSKSSPAPSGLISATGSPALASTPTR